MEFKSPGVVMSMFLSAVNSCSIYSQVPQIEASLWFIDEPSFGLLICHYCFDELNQSIRHFFVVPQLTESTDEQVTKSERHFDFLENIFDEHVTAAYNVAFRIFRSDTNTEDVVENAFVKVAKSYSQLDDHQKFRP